MIQFEHPDIGKQQRQKILACAVQKGSRMNIHICNKRQFFLKYQRITKIQFPL